MIDDIFKIVSMIKEYDIEDILAMWKLNKILQYTIVCIKIHNIEFNRKLQISEKDCKLFYNGI